MTKLRHFNDSESVRFITASTHKRIPLFRDPILADLIIDGLRTLPDSFGISICAFVVMPEHIHLVLLPPEGLDLGQAIGRFKALTALGVISTLEVTDPTRLRSLTVVRNGAAKHAVWTRRCYDPNCRHPKAVIETIEYCHRNPVERGLATDATTYRWSSAGWYSGKREFPFQIDAYRL